MASRIKQLVDKLVSTTRIGERLDRYPVTAKHFAKDVHEHRKPPYYCHAMAWRLGTWHSEDEFQRFEALLIRASGLPGWSNEKGLFSNGDYGAFWNLLWQLQVAEWVTDRGMDAKWQNPGPDLRVEITGQPVSIECYSAIGKYAPFLFLEELVAHLHEKLTVSYAPDWEFSGHPSSIESMLEECAIAIDTGLSNAERQVAAGPWPALLYSSPQGGALQVRLNGSDMDLYDSDLDHFPSTDLVTYHSRVLQSALAAKAGKNALEKHRPNAVLINMAIQEELQVADRFVNRFEQPPTDFVLPSDVDGVVWTIAGIDAKATFDRNRSVWRGENHPLRELLEAPTTA